MRSFRGIVISPFIVTILTILLDADLTSTASCITRPLYLPVRDVSISLSSTMPRGIAFGIGNPPQHVALQPSLMINSTFIPRYITDDDDGDCYANKASLSSPPCADTYGGGFITARSSTWTTDASKSNLSASEYDRRFNMFTNRTNGYDTLGLEDASNLGISSMPVVLPNGAFGNFSNSPLGLGEDSVFLSALHSSSFIPTKSWGLGPNGLCLGCIDAAAVRGTFVSAPIGNPVEKNCAMQVNVVDVGYKPANGSAQTRISTGTFPACVEPGSSSIILPQTVIDAYAATTGARQGSSDYATYTQFSLSSGKPDGALVFTLAGDFSVAVNLNPQNDSYYWNLPFGVGGWGSYEVGTFVLGQPFTDQVYLKYDDAAKTYGIAGGNNVSRQEIQGLGCELTADTPSAISQGSSSGCKFSTGAVVGAAVGGVFAAFLLMCSCCWLWWRRQMKKYGDQPPGASTQMHSYNDLVPQLVGRDIHEADVGLSSGYTTLRQELQ